jgi:hypothetical protein
MQGNPPFFHVIEFWLENRLMTELATPKMGREYKKLLKGAGVADERPLGVAPLAGDPQKRARVVNPV